MCLIFGAALLILTGFSAGALYLADRLDRDGRLAYAVVSDKRVETRTDSDGDTDTDHFVTFTFKSRGQSGQVVETEVGSSYYCAVSVGDERAIRYLADDPSTLEYDIGGYRRTGVTLRWIGLGLGIAGLAALWGIGSRANRAVRVRRDGEKRMAQVTGVREVNVTGNHRRQGRLMWREADGATGESLMRDAEALRRLYRTGDPIVVFRLGRHAYWEGDVGPPAREVEGR